MSGIQWGLPADKGYLIRGGGLIYEYGICEGGHLRTRASSSEGDI